jgi:hypothetical protein
MAVACLAVAAPLAAQSPPSPPSPPPSPTPAPTTRTVEFLPRAQFYMGAEHLSGDDPQFIWDANFGGEFDLVDWGTGRAMFIANYQVILGEEFKAFDPNQGNYILGFSGSARVGGVEVTGLFHHESRHLSDRFKRAPVDWNMVGARVQKAMTRGPMSLAAHAGARTVIQKSFVDYTWEVDGRLRNDLILRPGFGVLLSVDVQLLGVDGTRGRGTQTGVRAEGGLRIDGPMGAMELYLAAERRVDPVPLELGTASWLIAGFRLVNR